MRTCTVTDCPRPRLRREWCGAHYARWWRHGDPLAGGPTCIKGRICSVDGCSSRSKRRGMCVKHWGRWEHHGTTDKPVRVSAVGSPCSTKGCDGAVVPKSGRGLCLRCYRSFLKAEGRLAPRNPLYDTWSAMKSRCLNTNHPSRANYGERGITVCPRWLFGEDGQHPFECFLADMGPRPPGTSIERKDNDGPYSPENCKWATRREQQNNRRTNCRVVYCGTLYTISDLARHTGIKQATLYNRIIRKGWAVDVATTTPIRGRSV